MAKQLKTLIAGELEKRFKPLDGGVLVGYRGLNSEQIYDFRKKMREKGARFHVVKNTIAKRTFQSMGYDQAKIEKLFNGPTGVVYGNPGQTGVVEAIKALNDWKTASKDKFVEVRGGFLEGAVIDSKGVKALADLPSRKQLLAMVAGAFQAPQAALANRLYEVKAKFAYAIKAVEEKKAKETK
jgi:large subunit ribosomal protein L10